MNNESLVDDDFLLYRNLDVDMDMYCNELQKDIKRLPTSLRLIKEIIYGVILPNLDLVISDLEKIKQTPNYDEDIPTLPFNSIYENTSKNAITAIDCFNNHNIKKSKIENKMIYGTANGDLHIIDLDTGRNLIEEKGIFTTRIEVIKTSTLNYFDTFISRIAVCARGNPIVSIYSYNHSYSSINLDESLNLTSYLPQNQNQVLLKDKKDKNPTDELISLNALVSNITISKDSFFMVISTFANTNLIFKFNELPQIADKVKQTTENKAPITNSEPYIKLIGIIEQTKVENFNIVPQVPSEVQKKEDPKDKKPKEKEKEKDKKKEVKKDLKKGDVKDDYNTLVDQLNNQEAEGEFIAGKYNIKTSFDDKKNDNSALQYNDKTFVEFIQKNQITEDQENGFSYILISCGIYFSFYNSPEIKYFSLVEYFSKQMTAHFKVSKVRANQMSEEDLFAMKSKLGKNEREMLNFMKKKIEGLNLGNYLSAGNAPSKDVKVVNKDVKDVKKDPKNQTIVQEKEDSKTNDFTIITRVSVMGYSSKYNKNFNYLGLGLKNGSLLIWDCELHSDKFYLDTNANCELSHINLNEGFCFSSSLNGKVYIHSLQTSNLLYECLNNPYINLPLTTVSFLIKMIPCYSNLAFTIDTNNRAAFYYLKDQHKVSKFNFEYNGIFYDLQSMYFPLVSFNKNYIVLIIKDQVKEDKKQIIDMINFQKEKKFPQYQTSNYHNVQLELNSKDYYINKKEEINKINSTLAKGIEYGVISQDLFNFEYPKVLEKNQNDFVFYKHKLGNVNTGKNIIAIIKTKEVLMKCYPNLRQAIKIGFSIAKVMESHTLKSLPLFELKDKTYSKPYLLDIDNKQSSALIKELTPNNKFQHLTSKEHIKTTQNNTKNFYFNEVKNIQNRKGSASKNSSRDEDKMKTDFESLKKDLKNKNEEGSIMIEKEKIEKDKLPYIEENKILEKNSEKKNIFYQSFKSIQKRFSYRDQRVNKIELRNERIIKQLKLPKI